MTRTFKSDVPGRSVAPECCVRECKAPGTAKVKYMVEMMGKQIPVTKLFCKDHEAEARKAFLNEPRNS